MTSQKSIQLQSIWIKVGIVVCLAASLFMAMNQLINWDEFYFLSQIYEYRTGTLAKPVNTFHVHLFSWLTALTLNEVQTVTLARGIMWVCLALTTFGIYRICRAFFDEVPSLLATLAFIGCSFTLFYGTHFRTDPIATALNTLAMALLLCANLKILRLAGIAFCLGLSALITVKIVFLAPAFFAAGIWSISNSDNKRKAFVKLATTGLGTLLFAAILFLWHQSTLQQAGLAESKTMMGSAYSKTLASGEFFPQLGYSIKWIITAPVTAVLVLIGIAALCRDAFKSSNRSLVFAGVCFSLPILTLVFYRNSFPYFYPFFLPALMFAAAYLISAKIRSDVIRSLVVAGVFIFFAFAFVQRINHGSEAQSVTLDTIHQMFPEPVNYIDHSSAISSFPKKGFFMSSWGLESYRAKNEPQFKTILENETVPLLLANRSVLKSVFFGNVKSSQDLLPDDRLVLQQNFIPHWGEIYVAGKTLESSPHQSMTFAILIPGTYTLEAEHPIMLNEDQYKPGEQVVLPRGQHSIKSLQKQPVTLRWGKNIYRPDSPPPTRNFYTTF